MDAATPDTNAKHGYINKLFVKLPPSARGHVVAVLGEAVGTFFFLFFAFSGAQTGNVSSNPNTGTTVITDAPQKTPSQLLYTALAFGFSLAVNAWVFFRISGGLFNPAVTLGMVLIGSINILRGVLLFIAQMVGAIIAAYVVQALFTGKLNVSTTPSSTTTQAQAVLIEMLLTSMLVFTIFMLAAEKHIGNFIAPIGIGLALFVAELTGMWSCSSVHKLSANLPTGVFWTGGSLNPARSFAPQVALASFDSTHWIYWIGPCAGSVLAFLMYKLIKSLEYETANPDPEAMAPPHAEMGSAQRHSHEVSPASSASK